MRYAAVAAALAATAIPHRSVNAQSTQTRAQYQRYARLIRLKADSVWLVGTLGQDGLADPDSIRVKLASAGRHMALLAGDFEAAVPPKDFSALHRQLVAPIKAAAAKFRKSATLVAAGCSNRQQGCEDLELNSDALRAAVTLLASSATDAGDYQDARDRATRMLAEHGVRLQPMD